MPYNIESIDNTSNEQAQPLTTPRDHASLNEKNINLLQCLAVMIEGRSNHSDIKRCVKTGFLDNIGIKVILSLTFNRQD